VERGVCQTGRSIFSNEQQSVCPLRGFLVSVLVKTSQKPGLSGAEHDIKDEYIDTICTYEGRDHGLNGGGVEPCCESTPSIWQEFTK